MQLKRGNGLKRASSIQNRSILGWTDQLSVDCQHRIRYWYGTRIRCSLVWSLSSWRSQPDTTMLFLFLFSVSPCIWDYMFACPFQETGQAQLHNAITVSSCLMHSIVASSALVPLVASSSTAFTVFSSDVTFVTITCKDKRQEKKMALLPTQDSIRRNIEVKQTCEFRLWRQISCLFFLE